MEEKPLPIAQGDKIRLKADIEGVGLNGEILTVKEASPTGLVVENTNGDRKAIPLGERRLTYGHAITSHRAQGQSKDSTISVMGKLSKYHQQYRELPQFRQVLKAAGWP